MGAWTEACTVKSGAEQPSAYWHAIFTVVMPGRSDSMPAARTQLAACLGLARARKPFHPPHHSTGHIHRTQWKRLPRCSTG
eukprot:scaffold275402_cov36-Tisochrysis_lutea.AAC.2